MLRNGVLARERERLISVRFSYAAGVFHRYCVRVCMYVWTFFFFCCTHCPSACFRLAFRISPATRRTGKRVVELSSLFFLFIPSCIPRLPEASYLQPPLPPPSIRLLIVLYARIAVLSVCVFFFFAPALQPLRSGIGKINKGTIVLHRRTYTDPCSCKAKVRRGKEEYPPWP